MNGWRHRTAEVHECARLEELLVEKRMDKVAPTHSMCRKEAIRNAATESGGN